MYDYVIVGAGSAGCVLAARSTGRAAPLAVSEGGLPVGHGLQDHPTSTCRIGSVVDSHLKVVGCDGLRVVDASKTVDAGEHRHRQSSTGYAVRWWAGSR